MRVKKLMGLAVVLVALAVAVNALAFKTANVTNTTSITIDTTGSAALAMTAGSGTGFTADITAGYLALTFTDKFQPNSDYLLGPVFTITNKDSKVGGVTIATPSTISLTGGATMDLVLADGTSSIGGSLAKDASRDVYVKVTVPAGYLAGGGTALGTPQNKAILITANEN